MGPRRERFCANYYQTYNQWCFLSFDNFFSSFGWTKQKMMLWPHTYTHHVYAFIHFTQAKKCKSDWCEKPVFSSFSPESIELFTATLHNNYRQNIKQTIYTDQICELYVLVYVWNEKQRKTMQTLAPYKYNHGKWEEKKETTFISNSICLFPILLHLRSHCHTMWHTHTELAIHQQI